MPRTVTSRRLFTPDAPRVWTIPPGADFLGSLAKTLARQTGLADNPAALADALIYVPNRRSARALTVALYRESGGGALLPPEIRALGDLEVDEPPNGAEEALTDLGPALSPARRLGVLARLVAKFYAGRDIELPPASSISAARELGRLLDSAALAGEIDWSLLGNLVEDSELAAHWQDSVKFLSIVTEAWPEWLAEQGATEPFERRLIVAHAIAEALRAAPPTSPFIIAGSTGATPASRALMQAATALPNGLVILPGLDRDAPPAMWKSLAEEPDHPQFALAGTLEALELDAANVPVWPGLSETGTASARRRLVHESLAPAAETADWLVRLKQMSGPDIEPEFAAKALNGLSLIEASDEAHEALLAALMLRESLEAAGQTAALITPDANLARQVAAILKRWDVDVPPSGGIPLGRTLPGALALLTLDWAQDTGDPVALAALLKHPLVQIDKAALAAFETAYLRAPRHWDDLASLANAIPERTAAANASRHTRLPEDAEPAALALLAPLLDIAKEAALFETADAPIDAAAATETLSRLINHLTGDDTSTWSGRAGETASRCIEATAEVTAELAGLTPAGFASIFTSLAANTMVQAAGASHPRLAIWGPLEARLQQADRIILAGLNETVWPDRPAADAFLPRRFRAPLGLPAPEARLGLAAHDFAQLASAPDVTMLYAARRDDAPAVASRWVLRLKTLAEGALGKDAAEAALAPHPERDPRRWAGALTADTLTAQPAHARPRPNPPVSARPARLSVTRIDTLQRDPYAIYAGDILRLKKLDALNAPLDARPRGTAIHRALELFDEAPPGEQTTEALHASFLTELAAAGEPEHLLIANRAALSQTANAWVDWWQARKDSIKTAWPEARGRLDLTIAGAPFTLTGVADRIEQHTDGTYTIIDYKTGAGKTRKQIDSGFEQQLPLLGAMAEEGGFADIPPSPVGAFGYVSVRFRFGAPALTRGPDDASTLAASAHDILTRLITEYRAPDALYLSIPRIALKSQYAGDYDRLARRAEWAGDTDEGDSA